MAFLQVFGSKGIVSCGSVHAEHMMTSSVLTTRIEQYANARFWFGDDDNGAVNKPPALDLHYLRWS